MLILFDGSKESVDLIKDSIKDAKVFDYRASLTIVYNGENIMFKPGDVINTAFYE